MKVQQAKKKRFHALVNIAEKLGDELSRSVCSESCRPKKINHPPVKYHWYSMKYYELGIQKHLLGKVEIKVYSPEKTLVDCLRFPKKIPLTVFIEALKKAYYEKKLNMNKLIKFAEIGRIASKIKPYLEMVTHEQ